MAYLLKPKDMQTAPLDDLRYSKKRCDKLRGFVCGLAFFPVAISVFTVIVQQVLLGGAILTLFTGTAYQILTYFFLILSGVVASILIVLLKEEKKYFIPAIIMLAVHASLYAMAGILDGFVLVTIATVLMPFLKSLAVYNDHLKEVEGYPLFNRHKEFRSFEGTSRVQLLESLKTGGGVDAEQFFGTDIKSLRQNEQEKDIPDKTEWLGS
ncbi:MAG: hypothetical protein E7509_07665 [Ruminococcus sp.]|nr:hypothetical protein [Ruminococcus sp.]